MRFRQIDMPAVFGLTFASAAIAGRAMLRTRLGLLPLHLHQIVEARPGDGKSICLNRMGRPLHNLPVEFNHKPAVSHEVPPSYVQFVLSNLPALS
jgi:hypothetical protein